MCFIDLKKKERSKLFVHITHVLFFKYVFEFIVMLMHGCIINYVLFEKLLHCIREVSLEQNSNPVHLTFGSGSECRGLSPILMHLGRV